MYTHESEGWLRATLAAASTLLNANLIFVNLPAGFHKSKPPSHCAAMDYG